MALAYKIQKDFQTEKGHLACPERAAALSTITRGFQWFTSLCGKMKTKSNPELNSKDMSERKYSSLK